MCKKCTAGSARAGSKITAVLFGILKSALAVEKYRGHGPVYFSIRNAYQRYASVAGKFGGHIQTLRVFLRR